MTRARIVAVSMFKDEADVAEGCIRHVAAQVDHVLVADNRSTDGTREIVEQLSAELDNVEWTDDPDPAYYQSRKMSWLAENLASRFYGDADVWVVPFDADEIWPDLAALRDFAVDIVAFRGIDHRPTTRDDMALPPLDRIGWREGANGGFMPKVAFRWERGAVIHQGNHGVSLPNHPAPRLAIAEDFIRHFSVRSAEQFIRKARNGAAAYKATDLPAGTGAHWRAWGEMTDDQLRADFAARYLIDNPTAAGLVWDPVVLRGRVLGAIG